MGFAAGIFVALVPIFIREITSKNVYPYLGTAPVINESLGGFISFVIGYSIFAGTDHIRDTWIIMCSLSIIPLIVIIVCIKLDIIYESPIYLLRHNKKYEALQTYEIIYKSKYITEIIK